MGPHQGRSCIAPCRWPVIMLFQCFSSCITVQGRLKSSCVFAEVCVGFMCWFLGWMVFHLFNFFELACKGCGFQG